MMALFPPSSRMVRPEPARHRFRDAAADPGRAGEGDHRKPRVVQHQLAHVAPGADDEVEDPGKPVVGGDPVRHVLDGDGGERRVARRLPENRVSADRSDRRVPGPDRHGEVEGRDHPHDPQRMPLLVHPMARSFGMHGETVELARESDAEVADVDHLLDFAMALGADLSHLERNQIAERLLELAEGIPEVSDHLPALGGGDFTPGEECRGGGRGDLLVDGRRRLDDPGDGLARRGVERDQLFARGLREPGVGAGRGAAVHFFDPELVEQRLVLVFPGSGGGHGDLLVLGQTLLC